MVRIAINGYGRIGRIAHRIILKEYTSEIEVVAINTGSSTDVLGWAYLLKYDSIYGPLENRDIKSEIRNPKSLPDRQAGETNSNAQNTNTQNPLGYLVIDDKKIPVFSQKDPSLLPWRQLNVDAVIESTGSLRTQEKLNAHIKAGAKKVVLSSPAKDDAIATYVVKVNDQDYKGEKIISNASCTTNCIAPVAKIMIEHFGVEKAMMTTIHGYTSDQRLVDGGHKDYRRARSAAINIVPTTTGATKAAAKAVVQLADKFTGLAFRVPVPVGSLSDITFLLSRETTKEDINNIFKEEAKGAYKGIVAVTEDPIVSSDVIGNPHSAIVDLSLTQVVGGNMVKVIAWYDNEFGYAHRLVEEVLMVCQSNTSV